MMPSIYGAVARQVLTVLGTYVVARGVLDQGTADAVVGALLVIGSAAWSVVQKINAQKP